MTDPDDLSTTNPGLMSGASGVAAHLLTLDRDATLADWIM
jgi:hypothetical protein